MKTFKLIILGLTFCSLAHAETEIYAFTDYKPVRIMYITNGADVDFEAQKSGLSGTRKKISSSDIPGEREDRAAWTFKNNKIVVDQKEKDLIDQTKAKKSQNKLKLKNKLIGMGLDDEDIQALGVKI